MVDDFYLLLILFSFGIKLSQSAQSNIRKMSLYSLGQTLDSREKFARVTLVTVSRGNLIYTYIKRKHIFLVLFSMSRSIPQFHVVHIRRYNLPKWKVSLAATHLSIALKI